MNFDNTAALDAIDRLPARPAPKPERGAWASLVPAIRGGVAQIAATTAETLRAAGTSAAIAMEGDAFAVGVLGRDAVKAGADEARQRMQDGTEWQSAAGRRLRDYERDLRPDPETASTAEQLVYGAVRGLTVAILDPPLAA
jgi:hypothetical protein